MNQVKSSHFLRALLVVGLTGTFSAGSGSSITNAGTTDFVVSNSNATISPMIAMTTSSSISVKAVRRDMPMAPSTINLSRG